MTTDLEEISAFIKKRKENPRDVRRGQVILLFKQGLSAEAIGAATGYSRRQVFAIKKLFTERGIEGLIVSTKRQKKSRLGRQPIDAFFTELGQAQIRLTNVKNTLAKETGVKYNSPTSYQKILHLAGFSFNRSSRFWQKTSIAS